jgi:hypothetical protein
MIANDDFDLWSSYDRTWFSGPDKQDNYFDVLNLHGKYVAA